MDENRKKALAQALGQIEKQFGKGSVMRMGDSQAARDVAAVSTGSIGLDVALNKKVLAGTEILNYLRLRQVVSVAHLHGSDAEVIELFPDGLPATLEEARMTGMPCSIASSTPWATTASSSGPSASDSPTATTSGT